MRFLGLSIAWKEKDEDMAKVLELHPTIVMAINVFLGHM